MCMLYCPFLKDETGIVRNTQLYLLAISVTDIVVVSFIFFCPIFLRRFDKPFYYALRIF